MANYNFEIAKTVLSENDKNRLVCLFLNCQQSAINWEKATKEFGAASVESMKVMTRTALKKIETAGGKEGVDATATPAKTPKKRKAAATATSGDEGDDAEDGEKPKKKRAGRPKKAKVEVVADDEETGGVKEEEDNAE